VQLNAIGCEPILALAQQFRTRQKQVLYVAALQWMHARSSGGNRKEQQMKRVQTIIAATTGVLALTLATAISAAPYGAGCGGTGPGPGASRMHQGGMGGMGHGMGGMGAGNVATANLDQLKAQLAITAEQETAWQAFAKQASEQSKQMQAMHVEHRQATDLAAPAMMSLRVGAMTQRLAGMQAMSTALTDLYSVLTPQQRTTADRLMGHRGPGGQGMHRHGMRG
jgi:hypothetical protein